MTEYEPMKRADGDPMPLGVRGAQPSDLRNIANAANDSSAARGAHTEPRYCAACGEPAEEESAKDGLQYCARCWAEWYFSPTDLGQWNGFCRHGVDKEFVVDGATFTEPDANAACAEVQADKERAATEMKQTAKEAFSSALQLHTEAAAKESMRNDIVLAKRYGLCFEDWFEDWNKESFGTGERDDQAIRNVRTIWDETSRATELTFTYTAHDGNGVDNDKVMAMVNRDVHGRSMKTRPLQMLKKGAVQRGDTTHLVDQYMQQSRRMLVFGVAEALLALGIVALDVVGVTVNADHENCDSSPLKWKVWFLLHGVATAIGIVSTLVFWYATSLTVNKDFVTGMIHEMKGAKEEALKDYEMGQEEVARGTALLLSTSCCCSCPIFIFLAVWFIMGVVMYVNSDGSACEDAKNWFWVILVLNFTIGAVSRSLRPSQKHRNNRDPAAA